MTERFEMGLRLNAAAEQRQHAAPRRREVFGGSGRHRGGAHLGDQPAVHHRQGFAGIGAEQEDHRHVGRDIGARIAGIEADELQAHRLRGHRRHDAEIALLLLNGQHLAHRLQHTALRELAERLFHRRNQRLPGQQPGDPLLVEKHHHVRPPASRRLFLSLRAERRNLPPRRARIVITPLLTNDEQSMASRRKPGPIRQLGRCGKWIPAFAGTTRRAEQRVRRLEARASC